MEIGDSHEWVLWRAQSALGLPGVTLRREHQEPPPAPAVEVQRQSRGPRKRRRRHWGQDFQKRFSRWMSGGHDPEMGDILGYTPEVVRLHLERQFRPGMTWANYARQFGSTRRVWVVDHIVPKRLFSREDVRAAFALTNLRPLWMRENMTKAGVRHHLV